MRLQELLSSAGRAGDFSYEVLQGDAGADTEITSLVYDSRKAQPGSLFVCISGANADGHSYAAQVAEKGASVLVVSREISLPAGSALPESGGVQGGNARNEDAGNGNARNEDAGNETAGNEMAGGAGGKPDILILKVADTRLALAYLSAAWFGHPAEKLKTIGVTGTKGKTTTTYLVRSILENAGHRTGLIGTIEIIIGGEHIHADNTTPESYLVQEYFARMVDAGLDAVVMEVSSQALMLGRVAGIVFDIGVFTNLEPDHIGPNEHSSFEDYLSCKAKLFRQCKVGIANGDDAHFGQVMAGHTCELETYGLGEGRDLRAVELELTDRPGELGVRFRTEGVLEMSAHIGTPGRFSVYNALAAIAICRRFGVPAGIIAEALSAAHIKGRIEMVKVSDEFTLMIDYAHNAMALESLLGTLRAYHPERLVCLFGCGGNRAKSRRYEMGEVSGRMADLTIITSDNPRFEKPLDIIADIRTGIERTDGAYIEIPDRKEAIRYAITHGRPGDIIVLAGKGHEDYQEIEGKKFPMDERILIREVLEEGMAAPGGERPGAASGKTAGETQGSL